MPRDKTANHIKIMEAAKAEFLAVGYDKASMRNIGKRAGLTAAGIYRHCRNKEDLFDQLVAPAVERIDSWLSDHISRYMDAINYKDEVEWTDSEIDMMREIVYPHMDDYHLLIAKSKGTRYEYFLHDLTEKSQEEMLKYIPLLKEQGSPVWDVKPGELHLLLTAYVTALFEPVIHNYSLEEAISCLETVETFFLPGWKQLMGF